MKNKFKYVVYKATLGEEVLYIGSGAKGREKHCASGVSHVYKLNELHFSGANIVTVIVKESLSKDASLSLEKDLIVKHKPLYNVVHNDPTKMGKLSLLSVLSPLLVKELRFNMKHYMGSSFCARYKDQIREVLTFIGVNNLLLGTVIPSLSSSRKILSNPQSRGLFEQLYRKSTCEKVSVWLGSVFEYYKVGTTITLKTKEDFLMRIDKDILLGAGIVF